MAGKQFVVFKVENEDFGVDITNVREIIKPQQILKVPNSPKSVEGIINLRGKVQPIVNLRKKFHFPPKEFDERTKIIILNVKDISVGFIVDDVSEIIKIDEENMEEPPEIIIGHHRKYISKVGKIDERMIIILDLDLILSDVEEKELRNFIKLKKPHDSE